MAISILDFLNKSRGKELCVPWGYCGECVSMIQRYTNECFDVPLQRRGDAKFYGRNLVNNGLATYVTKPKYGDIIVWDEKIGNQYGHVAIYLDGIQMFDQNNTNVKPTRTSQYRKMFRTKPAHYVRMKKAPVADKPKYQDEIYAFKADRNVNIRENHSTNAKIIGTLTNGQVYNYIRKYDDGKHVWVSNGTTWVAVREIKNGVRQPVWGTLQAQSAPAKPKKEYVYLKPSADSWAVYPLGKALVKKNAIATLNPKKFGGLEYEILGRVTNGVTIQTRDYGKVNIYIGNDVKRYFEIRNR